MEAFRAFFEIWGIIPRNLKQLSSFKSANRIRDPDIYHKDYENDTFRTLFLCAYLTKGPVLPTLKSFIQS